MLPQALLPRSLVLSSLYHCFPFRCLGPAFRYSLEALALYHIGLIGLPKSHSHLPTPQSTSPRATTPSTQLYLTRCIDRLS